MKSLCVLAFVAVLCGGASAQALLSASAVQNPALINTTVSLTVEATATASLLTGCGIIEVREGSPTGPIVYQPLFCIGLFILVGPGTPYTVGWPGTATPGTYYVRIDYSDTATGALQPPAWFPVRVDDPNTPNDPILTSSGAITGGATTTFQVSHPIAAGATYIMAASQTTNTGFAVSATTRVDLDMDFVFSLSYPLALPGVFNNFVGNLDASGNSSGVSINVPPGIIAPGAPAAVQCGIIGTGGITVSNCLTFSAN